MGSGSVVFGPAPNENNGGGAVVPAFNWTWAKGLLDDDGIIGSFFATSFVEAKASLAAAVFVGAADEDGATNFLQSKTKKRREQDIYY